VSAILVSHRPAPARGVPVLVWSLAIACIGTGIALLEPSLAVAAAMGGAAALLTLIQPLIGVMLLLFAVPFGGLGRGVATDSEASDIGIGGAELVIALLVAAWLARGVRRRHIQLYSGPLALAVLGMVVLAAFSVGYAQDRMSALKETLKWLELLIAVLIVVDLVRGARQARWVLGAMFAAAAGEAVYGTMQFVTGGGPSAFELQGALRAFGHFDQPNPFAGYLTIVLPLAACMALSRANSRRFRLVSGGCAVLVAAGIGLSQSRGAWLGAIVACAALLLMWSPASRRLLVPAALSACVIVGLALSGLLPSSVLDRLSQAVEYFGVFDVRTVTATPENWAVVERMAHWQAGWSMFLDHPLLGVGAGNYGDAYPGYYVGSWVEPLGHAHNYYLNMLAELGLVGGTLLLLLLAVAFRDFGAGVLGSVHRHGDFWRATLAGVVGGLIVFCVHNMFDSLFVHSVNAQVGVLLGLGIVALAHLDKAVAEA
jgi:putative inorganic carbon (hco3(-)) transporter